MTVYELKNLSRYVDEGVTTFDTETLIVHCGQMIFGEKVDVWCTQDCETIETSRFEFRYNLNYSMDDKRYLSQRQSTDEGVTWSKWSNAPINFVNAVLRLADVRLENIIQAIFLHDLIDPVEHKQRFPSFTVKEPSE